MFEDGVMRRYLSTFCNNYAHGRRGDRCSGVAKIWRGMLVIEGQRTSYLRRDMIRYHGKKRRL